MAGITTDGPVDPVDGGGRSLERLQKMLGVKAQKPGDARRRIALFGGVENLMHGVQGERPDGFAAVEETNEVHESG
jgi:hypothetical protein